MTTTGMNRATGGPLSGLDHIRQSINDILTTPRGARVMRRDYGSDLYALIDKPMTAGVRQLMMSASAIAIRRWEPRVRLSHVTLTDGSMVLTLTLTRLDVPQAQPEALTFSL